MLPLFLRHDYWERKGNIPALTMLLQAYLRRAAPAIVAKGYLEPVLGIFSKLLAISRHYAEAYALLQAVIAYVPPADLQRYVPSIFKMLFGALTGPQKSTKNTVAFIVTVCKMACWHGAAAAAAALDAAQPNASAAILAQVMPNNLAHVHGRESKRAAGIAVARFLSEHAPLLAVRHWCSLQHVCASIAKLDPMRSAADACWYCGSFRCGNILAPASGRECVISSASGHSVNRALTRHASHAGSRGVDTAAAGAGAEPARERGGRAGGGGCRQ